jgi:integrase
MISLRKRGTKFYADLNCDRTRIRGPLKARSSDVARRLVHRLELAIAEGRTSSHWAELQALLPATTFKSFSDYAGVTPPKLPTWEDLKAGFKVFREQRINLGKFAASTSARYEVTIAQFGVFLKEENITLLQDITKSVVERFKVWRVASITKKKFSRGATGLLLDVAILHRVFWYAVENEMIVKNPVRMEGRPGAPLGDRGAQPFDSAELLKLREHAGADLLTFLLLRWTGFRGGDAVALTWQEVRLDRKEIERVTQKRRKKVIVPLSVELLFALEAEHEKQKPHHTDRVLLNPTNNAPMTRPRLYERMLALGTRAGIPKAHPHRFRDTLAVDMLSRGASPYDVAKVLGDTIDTVERHYTPFVKELRERVRTLLNSDAGLEKSVQKSDEISETSVTISSQFPSSIQ